MYHFLVWKILKVQQTSQLTNIFLKIMPSLSTLFSERGLQKLTIDPVSVGRASWRIKPLLCYCAYSSSGGVSGFGVVVEVEWIIPVIGNTVNYVTSSVLHSCRYTRGFFKR